MLSHHPRHHWIGIALVAVLLVPWRILLAEEALASDPPPLSRDELTKLIGAALPPVIGSDNTGLVKKLLAAKLGKPIREGFNLDAAVLKIFGKNRPAFAPDCRQVNTPVGDPDPGECDASLGQAEGTGAYTVLSFSKHLGYGTVKYLRRLKAPTADIDPATLKPVQLDKKMAYEKGVDFLVKVLGVPPEEIPKPPAGATNPYPVRMLHLGWMSGGKTLGSVSVKQVVEIQRGLFVDIPKPAGQLYGLPWVQAPGRAVVVLDDAGIWQARVRGWQELVPYPGVSEQDAKTGQELVGDIADDLMGIALVDHMDCTVRISSVPDGTRGLLLPAVQVAVSPVARDLPEGDQGKAWSTTGFVREYPLVRLPEAKAAE